MLELEQHSAFITGYECHLWIEVRYVSFRVCIQVKSYLWLSLLLWSSLETFFFYMASLHNEDLLFQIGKDWLHPHFDLQM